MSPMDQRRAFVWECAQQWWSFTELCERYRISRKTGYKWGGRYNLTKDLSDRSRRPHWCAHAIAPEIVARIVRMRRAHRRWGPKKILGELQHRDPGVAWPARSTGALVRKRHGLVRPRRRRVSPGHPGRPLTPIDAPNAVWAIDFKGQFRTRDGAWCYPLTITDGFSRYLLACAALPHPYRGATRTVLERVFRAYGLPAVIRSDNGAPFASTGLARLSRLSVWWMRLGIRPELIEPGAPQQNGRHERFHRTLKEDTAQPPATSRTAQARRFARFRAYYNHARPHEALGQSYPGALYVPSPRPFPSTLPPVEYPATCEVRYVNLAGEIEWRGHRGRVSQALARERVALDEIADGYWRMLFGTVAIGVLDERHRRVRSAALISTVTGGARVLTHARADRQNE